MWVEVLVASEAWGCPPIQVTGQGKDWLIVWFLRWRLWFAQKNKATADRQEAQVKQAKRKRGR